MHPQRLLTDILVCFPSFTKLENWCSLLRVLRAQQHKQQGDDADADADADADDDDTLDLALDALSWLIEDSATATNDDNDDVDSLAGILPSLQPFWSYLELIGTVCPSIVALNFLDFLEFGLPYFANLPFFGSSIIDDIVFVLDDLIPIFPIGEGRGGVACCLVAAGLISVFVR